MEFYQPGMREKVALDKEGGGGETERCFCNSPLLDAWSANVFFYSFTYDLLNMVLKFRLIWEINGILEISS